MRQPFARKPHAQFRLLAGDQVVAKAAHGLERPNAHHDVAAAGARLAGGLVPLALAQPIVDRALRMALAPAPGDDAYARVCVR